MKLTLVEVRKKGFCLAPRSIFSWCSKCFCNPEIPHKRWAALWITHYGPFKKTLKPVCTYFSTGLSQMISALGLVKETGCWHFRCVSVAFWSSLFCRKYDSFCRKLTGKLVSFATLCCFLVYFLIIMTISILCS